MFETRIPAVSNIDHKNNNVAINKNISNNNSYNCNNNNVNKYIVIVTITGIQLIMMILIMRNINTDKNYNDSCIIISDSELASLHLSNIRYMLEDKYMHT